MIDQNLLESLSSSDKESFARGLKELITQTYEVEKEFVELTNFTRIKKDKIDFSYILEN